MGYYGGGYIYYSDNSYRGLKFVLMYLLASFLVFCRFTCRFYVLGDKLIMILLIFDYAFACRIRLMHCKVLIYCIWNGFEAFVTFGAIPTASFFS